MAFASGNVAFVSVIVGGNETTRTFDSWTVALNSEVADVSDFDRRSAKFLPGLPSSAVTLTGPYAVGELLMEQGQEYTVYFGITSSVYIAAKVLVQSIRISQTVRGVARMDVAGIVTSDIENEDVTDSLYPNTTIEDL